MIRKTVILISKNHFHLKVSLVKTYLSWEDQVNLFAVDFLVSTMGVVVNSLATFVRKAESVHFSVQLGPTRDYFSVIFKSAYLSVTCADSLRLTQSLQGQISIASRQFSFDDIAHLINGGNPFILWFIVKIFRKTKFYLLHQFLCNSLCRLASFDLGHVIARHVCLFNASQC